MNKSIFMAICLGTTLYVLIASTMWGTPPFISLSFEGMRLLYIPSVLTAAVCGVIAAYKVFSKKAPIFYGLCLVFCLPMIAYFSYRPQYFYMKGYQGDQKLIAEFGEAQTSLLYYLMTYYNLHPDRFHTTGDADVVKVDGFSDYLHSLTPPLTWVNCDPRTFQDSSDPIVIKGDQILAPWGSPILFLLDTSGDGFIKTPTQKVTVNEYEDPWQRPHFNYKVAVGITTNDKPGFLTGKYGFDSTAPLTVLNDADFTDPGRGLRDWRSKATK
jgi:hypothetical protein